LNADHPILNKLLKRMTAELPKQRPSAAEALAIIQGGGTDPKQPSDTSISKSKRPRSVHDDSDGEKENKQPREHMLNI